MPLFSQNLEKPEVIDPKEISPPSPIIVSAGQFVPQFAFNAVSRSKVDIAIPQVVLLWYLNSHLLIDSVQEVINTVAVV